MSLGIARGVVGLVLAALLAACGGGGTPAGAEAFVAQVAGTPAPERRVLAPSLGRLATAAEPQALPTADETLDWAEFRLPALFPKGPASRSLTFQNVTYTVRSYPNGNHLGITAGGAVFGLGPFTDNALRGFGSIADYAAQIRADAATPGALKEMLVDGERAEAEVGIEVLRSFRPATITTEVNPSIGGQTVYEVAGTTPKGVPFKAVMLGDEGLSFADFRGRMNVQARLRRIQGQTVLVGRLIPRTATPGLNPVAFVAGAADVSFSGPAAGSVYQLRSAARFQGQCEADGLSGAYALQQGDVELTGALTGVREPGQPLGCIPGEVDHPDMPIVLSYTAVQTHMGIVFSFQGSLNNAGGASRAALTALSARGEAGAQAATRVLSPMPAQGLTIASPSLPATTMRATATVKTTVKQLAGTSGNELVSFSASDGRMVFNRLTGNLSGLAVNDIISSAPRPTAPNGFLRKVTRITNTADGKVEVRTAKALAGDLLDEADIQFDQPFDAADVQRAAALQRGERVYAAGMARPLATKIEQNFSIVLYDQDGDRSTTDDQVTVSGNFKVQPRVVVEFKCRRAFCSDPRFLGKFVLDEDAQINVDAKLKMELRESRQVARIPLPPITAGPLVFVPDIVVTVDVNGVARVHVEIGATQSLHVEAGVDYDNGQFRPVNVVTASVSRTGPTFDGSVTAKAGIYAALRLMLFGVAGVSAEAGPYIKFDAQYPGTPAWTLDYGIEGNLGVDIDLLILRKEWETKLFDVVFTTERAVDQRPKFSEVGSKYLCDDGYSARIGTSLNGGPVPVRLFALTDDREDGLGSGTIDWSSSLDGALGRTRKADKHEISAPLRNGTHTITAVLTDSAANTRTETFTVRLAGDRCQFPGGLPSVSITSDDNPFTFVVLNPSRSLTLNARAGLGTAIFACPDTPVRWRSNLESRNAGSSSGVLQTIFENAQATQVCNHSFTHVYDNLSPQTITAKLAFNGMTVTDSIDVGATLPLTPSLGNIQFTAPSATRYVYVGDQVSFSATGASPVWSSSVGTDTVNGAVGNNVSGRFDSIGQRTIVARIADGRGGFSSKSVTINVLSALARP